ncbi:hypothetical protein B0T17DRAFT_505859 [Bombardia bombarda]|uniref:Uncharacterized protein n=1 Tax=Bombardia bombarda TaxID=252184 RepID=A0AA39X995_9PEZI|nr:hypothetical protein B0T17DRAFT_505859 [Bombardia bombarda]
MTFAASLPAASPSPSRPPSAAPRRPARHRTPITTSVWSAQPVSDQANAPTSSLRIHGCPTAITATIRVAISSLGRVPGRRGGNSESPERRSPPAAIISPAVCKWYQAYLPLQRLDYQQRLALSMVGADGRWDRIPDWGPVDNCCNEASNQPSVVR